MNIFIYTTSDYPNGGAAENFVRQMAVGLNEAGAKIRVVRLRGRIYGGKNDTCISCTNLLFKKRPQNELLKAFELISIILLSPISVIINKFTFKTQVIILYGVEYSYLCIPFHLISKLLNIKIYRIITDYYDTNSIVPVWWKRAKLFFYKTQFKYIDKKFNGLIVLSNYLKELAGKNGAAIEKILLIPHFIDLQNTMQKIQNYDHTKNIIGFCGTPSISNGIIDLIKAFIIVNKTFKDTELLIIGGLTKEVKSIIDENFTDSEKQNITFTGFLNKEDVKTQLNRCTILVNPRKKGRIAEAGFPTKLGEYFSTKRPVVATAVGDLKRYFKNKEELILVAPDSPLELANGIALLLSDKSLSNKIGQNGFVWANANIEFRKSAGILLNFILKT